MKIKTFQFKVSYFLGNNLDHDLGNHLDHDWDKDDDDIEEYTSEFTTEQAIDEEVNAWISKNVETLHDIKTATYTLHRHNNGGYDTVILVYTLTYEPKTTFIAKAKSK